jgi:adenosine deaminase CECR1
MGEVEDKLRELDIEDDDEAWHDEQGVPRFTDPFIQQYLDGRDKLIYQEKSQRSGWFMTFR